MYHAPLTLASPQRLAAAITEQFLGRVHHAAGSRQGQGQRDDTQSAGETLTHDILQRVDAVLGRIHDDVGQGSNPLEFFTLDFYRFPQRTGLGDRMGPRTPSRLAGSS